eukprot:474240-Lingulodinium_polyedra.AAC.1
MLYKDGYATVLTLYLGEPRHRMEYSEVWKWENVVERTLVIWEMAKRLDEARCQRVRQKVQRFFATSSLLPARVVVMRLRSREKRFAAAVRRTLQAIRGAIEVRYSPLVARFLLSR